MKPPAAATGAWWVKKCADPKHADYAQCLSFVTGVLLGADQQAKMDGGRLAYCVPTGVTFVTATAVFSQYLQRHPEKHIYNAASLVMSSLLLAYPCKD